MTEESAEHGEKASAPRVDAVLEELRAHAARGPLGALALDVLGRQAEGRTLFVGREHVKKRAEEHGVTREQARTSLCNVLDLLEKGAESERERALLCALATLGLEDAVATAEDAQARALVAKAVRHACWLEVATGFALLHALSNQTREPAAAMIADELAQRLVDGSVGEAHRGAQARAEAAAMATGLAALGQAGQRHLASLASNEALDPVVRAMVRELAPGAPTSAESASSLAGPVASAPRTGFRAVLAWVSGWALLVWLARGLGALLGRTGAVSLTIRGRELAVEESGGLLGRDTRQRSSTVPLTAILSASRERRHGGLPLYLGALCFALGVLGGGFYVFDGLRSGELVLASAGAALVLAGVLVDLAVEALVRARGGSAVVVELVLPRGRVVRLRAPSAEAADVFLYALRARLR